MAENYVDLKEITKICFCEKDFDDVISTLKSGGSISFDAVWGSSYALAAAKIAQKLPDRPILLVFAESDEIERSLDDLALFTDASAVSFPAIENLRFVSTESKHERDDEDIIDVDDLPGSTLSLSDDLFGRRLKVLKNRNEKPSQIYTTSISSLLQPVPDPGTLKKRTQMLSVGDEMDQTELIHWLLEGGYHATPGVDLPGEYAVRGSIIDIFASDWQQPVRVEFFGDEIESIRRFDIATQRSLESIRSIDLSRIRADELFDSHFIDHLTDDTIVILVEPDQIEKSGRVYLDRSEYRDSLHTTEAVLKRLMKCPTVFASNLSQGLTDDVYVFSIESVERLNGDLQTVREAIDTIAGYVNIICPTEAEIKRLHETFAQTRALIENRLHFSLGNLSAGFTIKRHGVKTKRKSNVFPLTLIGSGQLFQRREIRRVVRRHLGQVIDSFLELKPGDLVVHVAHGIAKFRGLKTLTKDLQEEEYLDLEFAGNTRLYVPTSKIGFVQKYVGGAKSKVHLAKIGASLWTKQKSAVRQAVFDLAVEMLDIQAARAAFPGIAYPDDTEWQLEFDAAFSYTETDDQIVAIDAVKSDMRLSRPMDRLICGDVGFGKTEVAMRAVFKAVDSGFQAAVLVPTTILAEQHYRTFTQRMGEFPFTIASLSRFQSKKEQAVILEGLALGTVDVVIGTHRIVSKDVRFHNLGLVVIDEEQRFGVDHKERLKKLRQTVDVLTLTATPIPRTLHFSLLGLRDISNLETPPEDRLAVDTKLVRFHPDIIRSAILRELTRGGQVYFVHNRVMDIEETAYKIQRIVPEARIGIGHAQMNEHELETVMREFVNHEFDVLVCTTIIESGLDIPNANTIFVDRADRYGLADLHQLRGRVGRYKNQAYCYLLIDSNQPLTQIAAKRLRAIEEFSHLGAGFNIAMRDLEIRGAGNILGTQQSGHIATVGYEMYCQFLENAVRTLKQMPTKTQIEVEIDLPGRAMIPKSYVPNQRMKIDLYRRIARISNEQDLENIADEMLDRFGKPPDDVVRLLNYAKIRIAAHSYRIRSIRYLNSVGGDESVTPPGNYIVMQYVSQNLAEDLRDMQPKNINIRITGDMLLYIPIDPKIAKDNDVLLDFIYEIFGHRTVRKPKYT